MALYELLILGCPHQWQIDALTAQVDAVADAFALRVTSDIAIRTRSDIGDRDPKASTVCLYFGGDPTVDADAVDELEAAKVPIIPVVQQGIAISAAVPKEIAATNACLLEASDRTLATLTSVAFEVMGLTLPLTGYPK